MKTKSISKITLAILLVLSIGLLSGCDEISSSQDKEARAQEETQNQSIMQVGNPNVKNFREKKLLKDIYELRDQDGLQTYTYYVAQNTGELIFLGESIGYPIPYATQYNNPSQITSHNGSYSKVMPQAEPNGLYIPSTAEGTWVMLIDKNTKTARAVYVEERVICSPFPLK
jgi:hypothetical protein